MRRLLFQYVWRLQEYVWCGLQGWRVRCVRSGQKMWRSVWSKDVRYWMQSGCVWKRSERDCEQCVWYVYTVRLVYILILIGVAHRKPNPLLTFSMTAASFTPNREPQPILLPTKQPSTRNMLRHQDLFHYCVCRKEGAMRLPKPRHYYSQCSAHDHVVARTEDVPLC